MSAAYLMLHFVYLMWIHSRKAIVNLISDTRRLKFAEVRHSPSVPQLLCDKALIEAWFYLTLSLCSSSLDKDAYRVVVAYTGISRI